MFSDSVTRLEKKFFITSELLCKAQGQWCYHLITYFQGNLLSLSWLVLWGTGPNVTLKVPLTPVMHFQLSELCVAFKKHSLSRTCNSHVFPFFFHCWESIRKDCMLPKLLFNSRKKSWGGFESSVCFQNPKTLKKCCNCSISKGNNIGNLPCWQSVNDGKKKIKCL